MSQGIATAVKPGRGKHSAFVFARIKNGAVYVFPHKFKPKTQKSFESSIEENGRRLALKHWVQVKDRAGNIVPGWADRLPR